HRGDARVGRARGTARRRATRERRTPGAGAHPPRRLAAEPADAARLSAPPIFKTSARSAAGRKQLAGPAGVLERLLPARVELVKIPLRLLVALGGLRRAARIAPV